MKPTKTKSISVDTHSRKYRMLFVELILFVSLMTWSGSMYYLFPVTIEEVRQGSYILYLLFSSIGLFLLGGMGFTLGAWVALWRNDRHADS